MKKAQQLPNGYFNKLMTTYINLDVGKSSPLRKMNVDDDLIEKSIRLSFSKYTTFEQIDSFCEKLAKIIYKHI